MTTHLFAVVISNMNITRNFAIRAEHQAAAVALVIGREDCQRFNRIEVTRLTEITPIETEVQP